MKNYFQRYFNPLYMGGGGVRKFHDAGAGNGGGGGTETAEQKLLGEIKNQVKTELETRAYTNAAAVSAAITKALEGLPLEALRQFDVTKNTQTIAAMATKMENLEQTIKSGIDGGLSTRQKNVLKDMLKDKEVLKKIEQRMANSGGPDLVLNVRAAVAMTSQNVVDDSEIPEDILNSFSLEAFIPKRRPTEYIWEIASRRTVAKTTEYKAWMEEGDEEGAFAVIAEGIVKPLMSKTLVRNVSKYKKAAGKRVYTEEFQKFRQEAYGILEDLFNDQVMRNYAAILTTSLLAAAAAYVGTALDDQYTTPTDYHAIGAVAAQIESLDFFPDLLIINPQDKWRINLSQDANGQFYAGIPRYNAANGAIEMMGFRVYTTNRMAVGSFLLGESKLYKIEDEPISVRMGYGVTVTGANPVTTVEADFDHNRFRIIAETFFHSWIGTNHTGSFVLATFADVKAALQAPAI